ncbi:MAG: zinc ribbon domain-containing protein [Elusimicrobiota bacterium]
MQIKSKLITKLPILLLIACLFCNYCFAEPADEKIQCPVCHKEIITTDKFCGYCGAKSTLKPPKQAKPPKPAKIKKDSTSKLESEKVEPSKSAKPVSRSKKILPGISKNIKKAASSSYKFTKRALLNVSKIVKRAISSNYEFGRKKAVRAGEVRIGNYRILNPKKSLKVENIEQVILNLDLRTDLGNLKHILKNSDIEYGVLLNNFYMSTMHIPKNSYSMNYADNEYTSAANIFRGIFYLKFLDGRPQNNYNRLRKVDLLMGIGVVKSNLFITTPNYPTKHFAGVYPTGHAQLEVPLNQHFQFLFTGNLVSIRGNSRTYNYNSCSYEIFIQPDEYAAWRFSIGQRIQRSAISQSVSNMLTLNFEWGW